MRKVLSFLMFLFSFQLHGQWVVVRDPAWTAADEARNKQEMFDRAREYGKLVEEVQTQREHLQHIKEITEKLRKVNRKIANYHYLELSVEQVAQAYSRSLSILKRIDQHNCFKPYEYQILNQSIMGLVSQTNYTIQALTALLTDDMAQMTDGERMANISESLKNLREDLGVINAAIIQLDILDNQRMQIRTLKYLNDIFK